VMLRIALFCLLMQNAAEDVTSIHVGCASILPRQYSIRVYLDNLIRSPRNFVTSLYIGEVTDKKVYLPIESERA
jgi:hypothetical protein